MCVEAWASYMFTKLLRMPGSLKSKPSVSDLQRFTDFSRLSDAQVASLIGSINVRRLERGDGITLTRNADVKHYLFNGSVRVTSPSLEFTLDSRQPAKGGQALNDLANEPISLTCVSSATFFTVPTVLVGVSSDQHPSDWVESPDALNVEDISIGDLSEVEGALAQQILRAVTEERLSLPTMPELGFAVRRKAMDANASAIDLTRIIQIDVTIAAKVIQVANSPVYAGYESTKTLNEAIARMGLMAVRDIVTALTIKQLFVTKQPRLRRRMRTLWEHSTRVAAGASVLARHVGGIDSEQALLAGLVHDIGELAIIQCANQSNMGSITDDDLDSAVLHLKGPIGALLLKNWGLDGELIVAARFADDFDKQTSGEVRLLDLVQVSQLHAQAGTSAALPGIDMTALPAVKKLGLATEGPEKSISLLREARSEIEAIRLALAL